MKFSTVLLLAISIGAVLLILKILSVVAKRSSRPWPFYIKSPTSTDEKRTRLPSMQALRLIRWHVRSLPSEELIRKELLRLRIPYWNVLNPMLGRRVRSNQCIERTAGKRCLPVRFGLRPTPPAHAQHWPSGKFRLR